MNEQHYDGNWQDTQFTPEQWARVPSTARRDPWAVNTINFTLRRSLTKNSRKSALLDLYSQQIRRLESLITL